MGELVRSIRPELVFHLAAQVSVLYAIQSPYDDTKVNVLGTVTL